MLSRLTEPEAKPRFEKTSSLEPPKEGPSFLCHKHSLRPFIKPSVLNELARTLRGSVAWLCPVDNMVVFDGMKKDDISGKMVPITRSSKGLGFANRNGRVEIIRKPLNCTECENKLRRPQWSFPVTVCRRSVCKDCQLVCTLEVDRRSKTRPENTKSQPAVPVDMELKEVKKSAIQIEPSSPPIFELVNSNESETHHKSATLLSIQNNTRTKSTSEPIEEVTPDIETYDLNVEAATAQPHLESWNHKSEKNNRTSEFSKEEASMMPIYSETTAVEVNDDLEIESTPHAAPELDGDSQVQGAPNAAEEETPEIQVHESSPEKADIILDQESEYRITGPVEIPSVHEVSHAKTDDSSLNQNPAAAKASPVLASLPEDQLKLLELMQSANAELGCGTLNEGARAEEPLQSMKAAESPTGWKIKKSLAFSWRKTEAS
jgi:hypothetical protein